jgi:hypothetical protein
MLGMKTKKSKTKTCCEKLIYALIIAVLLAVVLLAVKLSINLSKRTSLEKCVLQQVTCCPCEMGGKQECMTEEQANLMQEKLAGECQKDRVCIAMYACENIECKYEDGVCKRK